MGWGCSDPLNSGIGNAISSSIDFCCFSVIELNTFSKRTLDSWFKAISPPLIGSWKLG